MGLDQDFYKLSKKEGDYKEGQIIGYEELDLKPTDNSVHIVDFRKEYALSEIIADVMGEISYCDYIIIGKESLQKIYNKMWAEYLKEIERYRKSEQEEDRFEWTLGYIAKVLETILAVFDFENYYLIYIEG